MKLRNKKTGEIVEFNIFCFRSDSSNGWSDFIPKANSLAEVNEDWEDYEPKEPLIKDERIRNTLRAWAEVNGIEEVGVVQQREITTFCDDNTDITFYGNLPGLIDGAEYTIAELCGEEEDA